MQSLLLIIINNLLIYFINFFLLCIEMLPQYYNNVSEIINKVPLTFLLANNFSNNSSNDLPSNGQDFGKGTGQ